MSIEVKPGRWRLRGGAEAVVVYNARVEGWTWRGHLCENGDAMSWSRGGLFALRPSEWDLIEYLGPEEPQATS